MDEVSITQEMWVGCVVVPLQHCHYVVAMLNTNRIAKASAAYGRLEKSVREHRGLSATTKLKVYHAVVITTLLHACETLTVYNRHAKQLNHFHTSCLRRLLRIKWQDKIPDSEVLRRASILSIHTLLPKAQLRWAGHVVRMPDSQLPKQLLYGELSKGKRSAGRQRYKDMDEGLCAVHVWS